MNTYSHDPSARLDYTFSWAGLLVGTDVIVSATVTPDVAGIVTLDPATHDDKTVTVWATGLSVNGKVRLVCHITTAEGRQDERTIILYVKDR